MSNPLLNEARWSKLSHLDEIRSSTTMTVDGALNKTLILIGLLVLSLSAMWAKFWVGTAVEDMATRMAGLMPWLIGGGIAGFVLVLVNVFAPRTAPVVAPLYAICEGIFLGALTMIMEARYPGLPILAAVITIGVTMGLVMLYRSGIIKVSNSFVKGVIGATIGVAIALGGLFILSMFGIGGGLRGALYGNGMIGIGFSAVMVLLATFNVVVDLKMIEMGAARRAPKAMEWQGAFGLLVTIVWLYVEILILLSKLRGRD